MEPIKPSPDIYRKAARIIESESWLKGGYVGRTPNSPSGKCYCMQGAIMKASGLAPTFDTCVGSASSLIFYADEFVYKRTKQKCFDCTDFNDSRRSAKPVIKMLNDIADALEKEQAGDQGS